MNINKKKLMLSVSILFLGWSSASAGLRDFKQDFDDNTVTIKDDSQKSKKQDENKNPSTETNTEDTSYQNVSQLNNLAQAAPAQEAPKGKLKGFYEDFKPAKDEPDDEDSDPSSDGNTYNYYHYDYPHEYYRYNYPYYYPYNRFYPRGNIIIYEDEYKRGQYTEKIESIRGKVPERHTWYNASLDSQYVSDNLSSVGMVISIVSAGKVNELSYGFKFDYTLFTEKDGADHYSLPLYHIGLITGKQLGKGLVESFIAYSKLEDLGGLSLKLSTYQWIHKYIFISGGIGVSVINDSPLTDMRGGVGFGNSILQLVISYRSQNSVNYYLKGPELRLGVTF